MTATSDGLTLSHETRDGYTIVWCPAYPKAGEPGESIANPRISVMFPGMYFGRCTACGASILGEKRLMHCDDCTNLQKFAWAQAVQRREHDNAGISRQMTSFWGSLTAEQRAKALAYRGPENHGSDEFRNEPSWDQVKLFLTRRIKALVAVGREEDADQVQFAIDAIGPTGEVG